MTIANEITIARILLIPAFVMFCIYYGRGVEMDAPQEWQRWVAIGIFLIAAVSDGVDGWVARRWKQRSRLGAILDPIADKGLLLTAIITLSLSKWTYEFPIWFAVLVITRDVVILVGCGVLYHLEQTLEVRPSRWGKAATACQMIALAWIMLQLPHYMISVYIAGIFTLVSGIVYLARGIRKFRNHDLTS